MGKRIRRRLRKAIKAVTKFIVNAKHNKKSEEENTTPAVSTPSITVASSSDQESITAGTSTGSAECSPTKNSVSTTSDYYSAGTSIGPAECKSSENFTNSTAFDIVSEAGTSMGPAECNRSSSESSENFTNSTVFATVSEVGISIGSVECSPDTSNTSIVVVSTTSDYSLAGTSIEPAKCKSSENFTVVDTVSEAGTSIGPAVAAETVEEQERDVDVVNGSTEDDLETLVDKEEVVGEVNVMSELQSYNFTENNVEDEEDNSQDPVEEMQRNHDPVANEGPMHIVKGGKSPSPSLFQFDQPYFVEGDFQLRVHRKKISLEYCMYGNGNVFTGFVRVSGFVRVKRVFIRFTLDEWKSCADVSADLVKKFFRRDQSNRYVLDLPYFNPGYTEFALCVESEDGRSWWDNNSGKNYRVGLNLAQEQTVLCSRE